MRHTLFLSAAALAVLAGCPDREVSEVNPQQGKVEFKDIPISVNRDLDLLFVIDNSGSMREEQDSLARNFPRFIDVLSTIEGGLPNYHIGVVTSDMGTLGAGDSNGCKNLGDDGNMEEFNNQRFLAGMDAAALTTAFSSIATVGIAGCGYESHLGAMRRALENPANGNFLRPDAYLGVIIIADEDDCSLKAGQGGTFFGQASLPDVQSYGCFKASTLCDGNLGDTPGPRTNCRSNESSVTHEKIQAFVDYLKSKKTDENLLIVAGIVGDSTPVEVRSVTRNNKTVPDLVPSCTYQAQGGALQRAFPAVRTTEFLRSFTNTTTSTICKGDLSGALVQVATLLKTVIGSPCIDSDLVTPYQCSVVDVVNQGKVNETRTVIGECDATASVTPCWRLTPDAQKCATTKTNLALTVDRGGATPAPDTHVLMNCVTK